VPKRRLFSAKFGGECSEKQASCQMWEDSKKKKAASNSMKSQSLQDSIQENAERRCKKEIEIEMEDP
jgi:hypothetical protein